MKLSILERRDQINAAHAERTRLSFPVKHHVVYEDEEYYGSGKLYSGKPEWFKRMINRNVRVSKPVLYKKYKNLNVLADVTIDSIDVHTTRSVYYLRVVNPETIKKLQEFVS